MENNGDQWEKMRKVNELMTQGKTFAQQLQIQLNSTPSSSSQETRELLAIKILESYQKSLQIMNSGETEQDEPPVCHGGGSPNSEDSDQEHQVQSSKKTMPRWNKKVRIGSGAGIESTLDDGFSWRKYGQKDILGAKFPRGYYRCTHRNSQGCSATKQVQRSDSDPSIFEVTYRGTHTCWRSANAAALSPTNSIVQNQELTNTQQLEHFRRNPHIATEGLDAVYPDQQLQSQSQSQLQTQTQPQQEQQFLRFPSSSSSRLANNNAHPFYTSEYMEGLFGTTNNDFSTFQGMDDSFHNYSEPEVAPGIVSASASSSNSSSVGLNFPFANIEFDPNCPFRNSRGFFS